MIGNFSDSFLASHFHQVLLVIRIRFRQLRLILVSLFASRPLEDDSDLVWFFQQLNEEELLTFSEEKESHAVPSHAYARVKSSTDLIDLDQPTVKLYPRLEDSARVREYWDQKTVEIPISAMN